MPGLRRARVSYCCVLLSCGLAFAGCDPILGQFLVPAHALAGSDFVVCVQGFTVTSSNVPGVVGCVLQLPPGFTVTAHGLGTPDDPTLLSLYTPEPGHVLTSASGICSSANGSTHFVVRAPATAGTFTLKAALAARSGTGPFQPRHPTVTAFASILHAPTVATITIETARRDAFTVGTLLPAGVAGRNAILADVDRDGRDDLIVGLGPRVFLSRPFGWVESSPRSVPSTEQAIAAGDFDGDGILDLVHGSRRHWFGDGSGGWWPSGLPAAPGTSVALAVGDVDGDGCADFVETRSTGLLECHRGDPARTFHPSSAGLPQGAQTDVVLADVDSDGRLDLVGSTLACLGDGAGNWTQVAWLGSGLRVIAGDFKGDARIEVVTLGGPAGHQLVEQTEDGSWSATSIGLVFAFQLATAVDFDHDLRPDLVLFTGSGFELMRNRGDGTFAAALDVGLPLALGHRHPNAMCGGIATGDFDGDSVADLVLCSDGTDWSPLPMRNVHAGIATFGAACAAPRLLAPLLQAQGAASLGNASFAFELSRGAPAGVGIVWTGWSRDAWVGGRLPFALDPFGATGCLLHVDPHAWHVCQLDASGAASVPLPIPNDPRLVRAIAFAQGGMFAPQANALALLTSNALLLIVE